MILDFWRRGPNPKPLETVRDLVGYLIAHGARERRRMRPRVRTILTIRGMQVGVLALGS